MIDTDVHTLKLDDPAELVAYVPYRLGFQPEESLVVLSVRERVPGEPSLGLVARFDLRDVADPRIEEALLAEIEQHLAAERCVAAWLLVYDDLDRPGPGEPIGHAQQILARWRERLPTAPGRSYLVTGTRWFCLECTHEPACPEEGRSREELAATAIAAAMVVNGQHVAPSRAELVRVRPDSAPGAAAAQRARAARLSEFGRMTTAGHRSAWRRRMARAWDRSVGRDAAGPGPTRYGILLAGLTDKLVRDAVLTSAMGSMSAEEALSRPEAAGAAFTAPEPPEPERVERALCLIEETIRYASPKAALPAWTASAWLAWWLGDGARCDVLLTQAERVDPDYRLAVLLRRLLDARIPPGWVDRADGRERQRPLPRDR